MKALLAALCIMAAVHGRCQQWVEQTGSVHFVYEKDTFNIPGYGRYWIREQFFSTNGTRSFISMANPMVSHMAIFHPDSLKQIFTQEPRHVQTNASYESLCDVPVYPFCDAFGSTDVLEAAYTIDKNTFVISFSKPKSLH